MGACVTTISRRNIATPGLLTLFIAGAALTATAEQPAIAQHGPQDSNCTRKTTRVHGNSMHPRLPDGAERPVIVGDTACLKPLARGDVVLFTNPSSDTPLIKRIVAAPGDSFAFDGAYLMINGEKARNHTGTPYRLTGNRRDMIQIYIDDYNGTVPAQTYLLLGEKTGGSQDSTRLGLIHEEQLMGRVIMADGATQP